MASLHVVPALLPGLKADPHSFVPLPLAAGRARDQGESRLRPRRRAAPPQRLRGEWLLTQPQFDAFFAWYETELYAGTEPFDVLVQAQGGALGSWWTARFTAPYQAQVQSGLRWAVSVELLLIDELGQFRVAPGLEASGAILFAGYAVAPASGSAGAAGAIVFAGYALAPTAPLRAEGAIVFGGEAFAPAGTGYILREDSGYILREDNSRILRE